METPKRSGTKNRAKSIPAAKRADIFFSPSRIGKKNLKKCGAERVSLHGSVAVATAVQTLVADLLDLSRPKDKRTRIVQRDIFLAIKNDKELDELLGKATFASSGAVVSEFKSKKQTALEKKAAKQK